MSTVSTKFSTRDFFQSYLSRPRLSFFSGPSQTISFSTESELRDYVQGMSGHICGELRQRGHCWLIDRILADEKMQSYDWDAIRLADAMIHNKAVSFTRINPCVTYLLDPEREHFLLCFYRLSDPAQKPLPSSVRSTEAAHTAADQASPARIREQAEAGRQELYSVQAELRAQKAAAEDGLRRLAAQKNAAEDELRALTTRKNAAEDELRRLTAQKNTAEDELRTLAAQKNIIEDGLRTLAARKTSAENELRQVVEQSAAAVEKLRTQQEAAAQILQRAEEDAKHRRQALVHTLAEEAAASAPAAAPDALSASAVEEQTHQLEIDLRDDLTRCREQLESMLYTFRTGLYATQYSALCDCYQKFYSFTASTLEKRIARPKEATISEELRSLQDILLRRIGQLENALTSIGLQIIRPAPGSEYNCNEHAAENAEDDGTLTGTIRLCICPGVRHDTQVLCRAGVILDAPKTEVSY